MRIKFQEGTKIIFTALTWDIDGEAFGPTILLEPVIRLDQTGLDPSYLIEQIVGELVESIEKGDHVQSGHESIESAGFNLRSLKSAASKCLGGTKFPKKKYKAVQKTYIFGRSADGLPIFLEVKSEVLC